MGKFIVSNSVNLTVDFRESKNCFTPLCIGLGVTDAFTKSGALVSVDGFDRPCHYFLCIEWLITTIYFLSQFSTHRNSGSNNSQSSSPSSVRSYSTRGGISA
jgi:hypothetical protein